MGYTVYRLTSPSGKVYIGITSRSVKQRWNNGRGYTHCRAMYGAIKKYGWENIQKEILLENTTESEAKSLEKLLIKLHRSNERGYGYNLTEGGDGTCGRKLTEEAKAYLRKINKGKKLTEEQKEHLRQINLGKHHTEETKKKMSATHKGKKYSLGCKHTEEWKKQLSERERGANNPRARKVICLETLKVYDTLTQAQKETGATKITDCCKHYYKHKSSNGLHWEYYNENLTDDDYKAILQRLIEEECQNKHHKPSQKQIKKIKERCSVSVICIETGEVFKSLEEACQKLKIGKSGICSCCKGKQKTAGGFHWKYVEKTVTIPLKEERGLKYG